MFLFVVFVEEVVLDIFLVDEYLVIIINWMRREWLFEFRVVSE